MHRIFFLLFYSTQLKKLLKFLTKKRAIQYFILYSIFTSLLVLQRFHTSTPHRVVDCEGNDFDATKLRGYSSKFLGQLSAAGAQQLHDLGKLLRHKYVDEQNFLSGYYSPSEVKCWSTKMRRTVESERCLLSG